MRLRNTGLYRYVISSNGAVINDIEENKVIYSKPIDFFTAKEVIKRCRDRKIGSSIHIDNNHNGVSEALALF